MDDNSGQFRRRFFVAMRGAVVAADLSEALSYLGPFEVQVSRTLKGVGSGVFDAVFATHSVIDSEAVDVLRRLSTSGTRVVLVNGQCDALAAAEGWSVLKLPFRQEDVQALLLEIGIIAN